MEILGNNSNPFAGYLEKLQKENKKVNPVHEIVNLYLKIRGWDNLPKMEYTKRKISYPRLAREAKRLLESCGNNLEDALWAVDAYNYKAVRGGFEWTLGTITKKDGKIKL